MRGKPPEAEPVQTPPAEPVPPTDPVVVEEAAPSEPAPATRRHGWMAPAAAAVLVLIIGAVGTTPYWAPPVMQMLPWGNSAAPAAPVRAPAPAARDDALAARVAALEAQVRNNQNDAALQALGKRISTLEARPEPDLTPLQNQMTSLAASVADLTKKIGALDKAQAVPSDNAALSLVLLQIGEAVATGRPFDAEYQALTTLSRNRPDIAAAAAPLAEPAKNGVASRAVLAARLRQLAPQIASASTPAGSSWRSQIAARLRSLVTIRRVDGAGQSPAEAAVSTAERALAGGDLNGAIAALAGLDGGNLAAAEPWLGMARQRLAVETALRRIATLVAAELGAASAKPG